jgi:hypothetical protein
VGDDLVFGLLQLDKPSKLIRLSGFPFANDFRVRLEDTHDLLRGFRYASGDSRPRLMDHSTHSIRHGLEMLA